MTVWRRREPLEVPMLSGACILTRRSVIDRVGGFDPGYFLYYEDTDWCRRVRLAGYPLVYVPDAEIVHYFNQSAQQDVGEAQDHARRSQARFVAIHYGRPGRFLYTAIKALHDRPAGRAAIRSPGVIDFGVLADAPTWRLPESSSGRERVVEIGFNRRLVPAAAAFAHGADFHLSPAIWTRLQPGRYYARLLDAETLQPLGAWSWVKG
jgi:GT2 family glycosyltransferase